MARGPGNRASAQGGAGGQELQPVVGTVPALVEKTAALTARQSESAALMSVIAKAAGDPTIDVAKLQALLDVKERWEAGEARKEFLAAMVAFKDAGATVIKNKLITDGPLKGKRYADLFAVVDSIMPLLTKHGLSHSWAVTRDEEKWIEVTCILTHVKGHSEKRSMGGPPDAGGAKNSIQARASTVSYLERYTLLAVVGMTSAEQDTDGRAPAEAEQADPWTEAQTKAAAEASQAGTYGEWWKAQAPEFRAAAIHTKKHADFKAVA